MFKPFKKRKYLTNTFTKEQAVSKLMDRFIVYIVSSFAIGFLPPNFFVLLSSLNIEAKDSLAFSTGLSITPLLIGIVINFDFIKDVISAEIDAVEKKHLDRKEIDEENFKYLSDENKRLLDENKCLTESEKNSDYNSIKEQMLVYLADLYMANEDRYNRERIIILASQIYGNDCKPSEVKSNLTKQFANEQERRKLRAVIITIKKDSWKDLATLAGYHTFGLDPSILEDKNKLNNGSEKLFCLDIYTYLYAWLVSSIDNKMVIQYMPVEQIGLNYPTVQSPDFEKYKSAFDYLIDIFTNCELSEIIDDHDLSSEQIEVCKGISPYLEELIKRLKEFDISQRVLAAN